MSDAAIRRRPLSAVPHALDTFADLATTLGGRTPALFLDYDGTLTGIMPHPDDAVLSDSARQLLRRVAEVLPVAVVSGRDRPNVERMVGIDHLTYAGSHGFDVEVAGGEAVKSPVDGDWTEVLDKAEQQLHDGLADVAGSLVERKKFSIAAHYRGVAEEDYSAFRAVLDGVARDFPDLKEKTGKKIFEFQPAIDWDKGRCVLWLLEALDLRRPDIAPLFLGDDVTDEDAFAALQGTEGGLGIVCADAGDEPDRATAAAFRVDDPDQVLTLLARLAGIDLPPPGSADGEAPA